MNPLLTVKAEEQAREILGRNLQEIRTRIEAACTRSGRDPESIKLVLSTKYVDASVIRLLYELGVTDIGENRVQDTQRKQEFLSDLSIKWHMFGHLQRNKVKKALKNFGLIHSVENLPLAEEIDRVSVDMDIDNVDTELCRNIFRGLRRLSEDIEKSEIEGVRMQYLSMGMTQDFEIAVEEGSSLLRIGSAVFRGI